MNSKGQDHGGGSKCQFLLKSSPCFPLSHGGRKSFHIEFAVFCQVVTTLTLFKCNFLVYEFELSMDLIHYQHMPSSQFLNYVAADLNYYK